MKERSDIDSSPSPDEKRGKNEEKTVRKLFKKIDMDKHLSSTEEPDKKVVITSKKTSKPKTARKLSKNRPQEYEDMEV